MDRQCSVTRVAPHEVERGTRRRRYSTPSATQRLRWVLLCSVVIAIVAGVAQYRSVMTRSEGSNRGYSAFSAIHDDSVERNAAARGRSSTRGMQFESRGRDGGSFSRRR